MIAQTTIWDSGSPPTNGQLLTVIDAATGKVGGTDSGGGGGGAAGGVGGGGDEEGDDGDAELRGLALARATRSESDPVATPMGSLSPAFDASSNASPTLARASK